MDKAGVAESAPRPVLAGPGFALLPDAAALGSLACGPHAIAGPALTSLALEAEDSLGVDAQLVVVLGSAPFGCSNLYYLPLANDVRGIGYRHAEPREVFDLTPEHRLEGIAFLNDWPYWRTHPAEFASAFDHELGHRFGARVHTLVEGRPSPALLGRDLEHWSYFFSTSGSPLEGNVWLERGPGFISDTPPYPVSFSPLDLYLMGVLPAENVPAARLLLAPQTADEPALDCAGLPLAASSPPQTCEPRELTAQATRVSIEDIIAVEGQREPPAEAVTRSLDVLPLVIESGAPLGAEDCEALQHSLRERFAGFADASGGRVLLRNVLGEDVGCDELGVARNALDVTRPIASQRVAAPGCGLVTSTDSSLMGLWCCVLAALVGATRRQSRRGEGRRHYAKRSVVVSCCISASDDTESR